MKSETKKVRLRYQKAVTEVGNLDMIEKICLASREVTSSSEIEELLIDDWGTI